MSDNINNEFFDEEIDNIIVLNDENGNEMEFEFIDLYEYEGEEYVVLLPVDEDEEEVVILKVVESEDEDIEEYVAVEDEDALNAVYQMFREMYKDEFNFTD